MFVCQKGELELKSILLAWSLRKTHGSDVCLIAAVPNYKDWGFIAEETMSLLKALNVELKYFNPIFGDTYPIGNKISAIKLLPPNEHGCFCDSDMLSLSHWRIENVLQENLNAAKPADLSTWGGEQQWEKVYALTSMELPTRRVRLTVSQTLSFPYFNAGFIASKNPTQLASYWSDYALQLHDKSAEIENKYPWLDQISLPIAMQKLGSWRAVSEFYNYPAHLKSLGDQELAMCHYHGPNIILREPRLRVIFDMAVEDYPAIKSLVKRHAEWMPLLENKKRRAHYMESKRNFIITGIPRSGTSYITSLLDSQMDWLVINEPGEIFNQLQSRTDASGIAQYYAECRERVLSGKQVTNKLKDGKVIEDTAILDKRELYHPNIQREDFWLGSKNTLAYIASLEYLVKLQWPIIAMVRNPLDTLASWRKTFGHLAEARVSNLPVANPDFPAWATWQRQALLEIDSQIEASLRRVLLWRLLARTILHYEKHLLVWRYEDLMKDPRKHLNAINACLNYEQYSDSISSNAKNRSDQHDSLERELLNDLCAPELAELKYTI
ncbi:MAG: sulfotransferase [Cellvibrio sp.]|uniref:sulfotransferase n=1 Tax=Cellvibrio sp. TaxID=1965322 RepID=UPI0031AF25D7